MDQSSLHSSLIAERDRVLAAFDALVVDGRATTVDVTEPGGWTAQDVLAHLLHMVGQLALAAGRLTGDVPEGPPATPPGYLEGVTERLTAEQWNERAIAWWRARPIEELRADFVRNASLLVDRVGRMTDADLARTDVVPWQGAGRPFWHFLGYDTCLHEWPAHAAQLEAAAQSA